MIKNGMAVLSLALAAALVHADDYPSPTDDRVRLSLGVMRVSTTTDLRLDSSQGVPGTSINGENDLGLDKSDYEPKFQAMVRVGERHRLRFDYFTLDRTGQTTVTGSPHHFSRRDPADRISGAERLEPAHLGHHLRILVPAQGEIRGGRHPSASMTRTSPPGRAFPSATLHVDQREDQAGPVPSIGLDGTYVVSQRFYFDARAQYLKVAIDHIDGSLGLYEFDALYRLRPNVSFALGYNVVRATLDSRKPSNSGYFDIDSQGSRNSS